MELQHALLEASAAERAWGLAPEVARSVGVSCNRARRLWFAGPALDHLLTWRPAPLSRAALCLHCHSRANAVAVILEHCRRRPPFLLPPAPASKAHPPRSVPQLLGCPSNWNPGVSGQLQRSELQSLSLPTALTDAVTALYPECRSTKRREWAVSPSSNCLLVDTRSRRHPVLWPPCV